MPFCAAAISACSIQGRARLFGLAVVPASVVETLAIFTLAPIQLFRPGWIAKLLLSKVLVSQLTKGP
ncbi:hypothetical protein D3C86_1984910 [compost metagenome]